LIEVHLKKVHEQIAQGKDITSGVQAIFKVG